MCREEDDGVNLLEIGNFDAYDSDEEDEDEDDPDYEEDSNSNKIIFKFKNYLTIF